MVISTDPDAFETAPKTVLETYIRQVDKLVHLTINGEKIITTDNHPFYVQGRGFIEAGNLLVGDKLISVNGGDLIVDDCYIEECENLATVYNFQVEDYHTYFVGECAVWVHNAENYLSPSEQAKSWQGKGKYPGVDEYTDVTVNRGTVLYRGEPNGSEYFTTLDAIEGSGRNATTIFEGLQVEKHPIYGYRSEMQGYVFNQDIAAAYGITNANPQFDAGGLPQYFVPDVQSLIDSGILTPVDNISLY